MTSVLMKSLEKEAIGELGANAMKKMVIIVAIFIVIAISIIAGLVIYSENDNQEIATPKTPAYAVVVVQSANNTHISIDNNKALSSLVDDINVNGGQLSVILASSNPEELIAGSEIPVLKPVTPKRLQGRYEDKSGPLAPLVQIDTIKPQSTEVDYVESIRAAASELNSQENKKSGRQRSMYIFGSGIDTTNEKLSFTKGILSGDYKAAIDNMASLGVLPDLNGVDVDWVGLAQTVADPQMKVPYEYRNKMQDLWEYFLEACGAQSVNFESVTTVPLETNTVEDGYPYVTPIPFAPTEDSGWVIDQYISFTENVLGFNPNEDTYRDGADGTKGKDLAKQVLSPYAIALKNSGQTIVICGSAWNDGSGDEVDLSRRRAERVRKDLIAMGVPSSQLKIAAAGNLGVNVHIGDKVVDFYHPDQPEESRAIHFIPTDNGQADDVLARFAVK